MASLLDLRNVDAADVWKAGSLAGSLRRSGDRTPFSYRVGGKTRELSRRAWLDFAATIGLPTAAAVLVLEEVLDGTAGLPDLVEEADLPFTPHQRRAFAKNVKNRRDAAASGR